MTFDPYRRTTSLVGNYYNDISSSSEINIRQELINMFDGAYPEIPKASIGLLRKMRRDTNGLLLLCPCVDIVTREPDKDRFCPYCFGEGYYWDEVEVQYYCVTVGRDVSNISRERLTSPGLINPPLVVFYIRYDVPITIQDKIIKVSLDLEGSPAVPRKRDSIYRVTKIWDYRLDNAKLEYWKIYTYEEYSKYLNGYGG
jgi:hypothetical protein